jgi:tetratricopeptide (TPR) repeat protein
LAQLYRSYGRAAEAGPEFRRALELIEKLAADYPARLDYQSLLGQILQNHAIFLRATGRFTEAEPVFRRAISHLEALAVAHPEVVEIRSLLAGALAQAGDLLQILHRPGDAERAFRSGAELAERLAAEFPDVPGFANAAAVSLTGLAQLALDLGELARARQIQEQLVRHARAALGANRRNSNYRGTLLHGYGLLAGLQIREGDDRASEGSARAMEALAESPVDFYNAACYLGLLVKGAASAPWPDAKRAAIALSYGNRAVASLRMALDRGYRNPGLIRTDPDLDSLRSRPDFQLLMMDLAFPAEPFAAAR